MRYREPPELPRIVLRTPLVVVHALIVCQIMKPFWSLR
jgi:hypothetical protein